MNFSDLTKNVIVFNPGRAPEYFGKVVVPAKNYTAIPQDTFDHMKSCGVPVINEHDPEFRPLFVHFG